MNTAQKLKKQRGSLTQEQAAAAIGCPVATYRDWEQGRSEPSKWRRRMSLALLSDAAQTELIEYWDGSEKGQP